jgi:hypothetical protein
VVEKDDRVATVIVWVFNTVALLGLAFVVYACLSL